MNNTQSIVDEIQSHKEKLRSFGVSRIGIFGSQIRGEATSASDVDVLLDFYSGKKTYRNFIGTATLLEQILNCHVDVLTQGSVSPYLKPQIEKDIQYVQI